MVVTGGASPVDWPPESTMDSQLTEVTAFCFVTFHVECAVCAVVQLSHQLPQDKTSSSVSNSAAAHDTSQICTCSTLYLPEANYPPVQVYVRKVRDSS